MILAPGTRLGPYEILALIGAGGMGEVYRANDTRLSRVVALKILASGAMRDSELRRRFEREAHAVAQLSHPHVCSLFDVGRDAGIDFLVMELVEGDTLAARLAAAPDRDQAALDRTLPIGEVLRHAAQIAEALDAAHQRGIVHRDLKPGNVMVTRHGVKVVDFGLARIVEAPPVAAETATASFATKAGSFLGTLQYMAPEQIEGKSIDGRADIFALGATLYEMCTGERAFNGNTAAGVVAAVLTHRPPLASTAAPHRPISKRLDRLIAACLEKNPADRWQSAGDLAKELHWLADETDNPVESRPEGESRTTRHAFRVRNYTASAIAAVAVVAAALVWSQSSSAPPRGTALMHINVATPPPLDFADSWLEVAAAPDGRSVVFVAAQQHVNILWIRTLDSEEPRPLEGTEDARSPFWSPDGRYIGFSANGKLWKTTASPGPVELITDIGIPMNGSWTSGGEILFENRKSYGIYRVAAAGGQPIPVLEPQPPHSWPMWPHALSDGRHFIYFEQGENRGAYVASLDGRTRKLLIRSNSRVEYAEPGYLLFVREGVLFAQRFDLGRFELRGDPVPLASKLGYFLPIGTAQFSVSPAGVLAYRSGQSLARLTWLDRAGLEISAMEPPLEFLHLNLSPDGARAAADVRESKTGTADLWVYDLERSVAERITATTEQEIFPVWSPDGRRLAFSPDYQGPPTLWVRRAGGGTDRGEVLLPHSNSSSDGIRFAWSWHPDGGSIIYSEIDARRNSSLWMLPLGGDRKPVQLLGGSNFHTEPTLSPDGRWLAFRSGQSGRSEIHVMDFPRAQGQRQVTTGGGRRPRWIRRGQELVLFYLSGTHLMEVRMGGADELRPNRATPVFRLPPSLVDYDVVADGSRFLAAVPVSAEHEPALNIVVNWTRWLTERNRPEN